MSTSTATNEHWWKASKEMVPAAVIARVRRIEEDQAPQFDRFVKMAALYDPHCEAARTAGKPSHTVVIDNVVASNVDTVHAAIATRDVRARFLTDGGDWATQRRARRLEWYAEGIGKLQGNDKKCELAFGRGATVRGTGLIHVYDDRLGQLCTELVYADDVFVPDSECAGGRAPRQVHRRKVMDRDELVAQFPEHKEQIDRALNTGSRSATTWTSSTTTDVVTIWSYRLPAGVKDQPGYTPGRFTIVIDNFCLLDEPWEEDFFPFARAVWEERDDSFYGISLAEQVAPHQLAINKLNWQIDRGIDRWAVPTQYVRKMDAKLAVTRVDRAGAIAVYNAPEPPKTDIPPAVSPEVYARTETLLSRSSERTGISRMASQAVKPAGLDSGVALREYRDQTTQRFSTQEEAFEQLQLDVTTLQLYVCKKLGAAAPKIMRRTRFGAKRITWSQVDMGDVKVMIAAASRLPRTPAGKTQLALELAQAGVISQDSAKRLIGHPDIEREMSIYTAALENLEHCFDAIADGKVIVPEPFMNLKMCVWRGQQQYLLWQDDGAPERVLEVLRQFVVQAAGMLKPLAAPANENAAPGAPPMPMGGEAPLEAQPAAALAPEAMNLKAS